MTDRSLARPEGYTLFRQTAIDFQQQQRHYGQIALLQSPSTKILAWLLTASVGFIILFLCFAQYTRKETVSGYLTPASGTAGPPGALLIGLLAGGACFLAATRLKRVFGYDDSLDVFGVHAVGGIVGAVLTGVTAGTLGGVGLPEGVTIGAQVWIQAKSVLFTAAWSGLGTYLILRLLDATVGVRVSREQEVEGLDLALHDERAYNH